MTARHWSLTRFFGPLLTPLFGPLLTPLLALTGCLTNEPDPGLGHVYACTVDDDCPGVQTCLQSVCENIEHPLISVSNPEDEQTYAYVDGLTPHAEIINIVGANFVLRSLAESNEAVPGEGHLVVFLDEVEVGKIEVGDVTGGVPIAVEIPDVPGVHRIRVQARLNDGTNYDTEGSTAKTIVWVDDGRKHVALRYPWPGESFPLESVTLSAEIATLGLDIGPPKSGKQHVHVYYDEDFPGCIDIPLCQVGYNGVVPSDDDDFGPVVLPSAGAGMVTLTALIADSDHSTYLDELDEPVFSESRFLRTNTQAK